MGEMGWGLMESAPDFLDTFQGKELGPISKFSTFLVEWISQLPPFQAPLAFAAAALYECAEIGEFHCIIIIPRKLRKHITFVCFFVFLFFNYVNDKISPLKMLKGSGDEGKKNVLMNRFLNMRKYNKLNKFFFDFWNRKSPLCTLFYEIQTCQVCVFIQTGYKLHFYAIALRP